MQFTLKVFRNSADIILSSVFLGLHTISVLYCRLSEEMFSSIYSQAGQSNSYLPSEEVGNR